MFSIGQSRKLINLCDSTLNFTVSLGLRHVRGDTVIDISSMKSTIDNWEYSTSLVLL
jgi:hypothetical protein